MTDLFHLSLPVNDLDASRRFYENILCAKIGRVTDLWLDVWLFGAQVTLQQESEQPFLGPRGKFHLGGTLSWSKWRTERDRMIGLGVIFEESPKIDHDLGQAKMYIKDPDGYVIEIKAYKDVQHSLRPQA